MSLIYPHQVNTVERLLQNFLPFAKERLGYENSPNIRLAKDEENAKNPLGKTGYYEPDHKRITVYIDGRHPKDIMRSISHELVHHAQNVRGDLNHSSNVGEQGYAQNDEHLREMEREAYEQGNLCFRDWEDGLKMQGSNLYESLKERKYDRDDLIDMIRDYSKELTGRRGTYGDFDKLSSMTDEQLKDYYQGMFDSPEQQFFDDEEQRKADAELGHDEEFDMMRKQSGMGRGVRERFRDSDEEKEMMSKMSNKELHRYLTRDRHVVPNLKGDKGPIDGMEGPFQFRSGAVLYYDPKAGKYYDRDRDMFIDNEEASNLTMESMDAKLAFPLSVSSPEFKAFDQAYEKMSAFHKKHPSKEGERVLDLLVNLNAAVKDAETSLYRESNNTENNEMNFNNTTDVVTETYDDEVYDKADKVVDALGYTDTLDNLYKAMDRREFLGNLEYISRMNDIDIPEDAEDDRWNVYDMVREAMGDEQFLQATLQAMSTEDATQTLDFIMTNYGIDDEMHETKTQVKEYGDHETQARGGMVSSSHSSDPEMDNIVDLSKDVVAGGGQLMQIATMLKDEGYDATLKMGVLMVDSGTGKYFIGKPEKFDIGPDEQVQQAGPYVVGVMNSQVRENKFNFSPKLLETINSIRGDEAKMRSLLSSVAQKLGLNEESFIDKVNNSLSKPKQEVSEMYDDYDDDYGFDSEEDEEINALLKKYGLDGDGAPEVDDAAARAAKADSMGEFDVEPEEEDEPTVMKEDPLSEGGTMSEYGAMDAEQGLPPSKIGRGNEEYMKAYNAVLVARGEEPMDVQQPDQAYLDALHSGTLEEEEKGKYDDGDGKKEKCDFVDCEDEGDKKELDETGPYHSQLRHTRLNEALMNWAIK